MVYQNLDHHCRQCKGFIENSSGMYCSRCVDLRFNTFIGATTATDTPIKKFFEKVMLFIGSYPNNVCIASVVFLLGLLFVYGRLHFPKRHSPGILVHQAPVQRSLVGKAPWMKGQYRVNPLASYSIKGVVLEHGSFFFSSAHELSPVDLTLGWSHLSDQAIIDQVEFVHTPRVVYLFPSTTLSVPFHTIEHQFSNNHLIPRNDSVAATLLDVRIGDIVSLKGYLVEITGPNFYWNGSLTRDDNGCEVMWVDEVVVE